MAGWIAEVERACVDSVEKNGTGHERGQALIIDI